ncbi:cutinase family protein [Antrihabitans stalactiti]|nr:cutinase family protein [Antrihabitans stalactiti]
MNARSLARFMCAAIAAVALPMSLPTQSASAAPCSDIEVVFARGTVEPGGPLGITGIAFTESLRLAAIGKSVSTYAVNYPASANFADRLGLAHEVLDGIKDAQARVQFIAATCPGTKIVIGGYSQGAVVAGFATMAGPPPGTPPEYLQYLPTPMPAEVASHVAAVVLYAKPSDRFMTDAGAPPIVLGPQYAAKSINFCIAGDNICNGAPLAQPNALHVLYVANGDAPAGAGFTMSHL